jgi:hypothetical protein
MAEFARHIIIGAWRNSRLLSGCSFGLEFRANCLSGL